MSLYDDAFEVYDAIDPTLGALPQPAGLSILAEIECEDDNDPFGCDEPTDDNWGDL
jgi:hypothetical protein